MKTPTKKEINDAQSQVLYSALKKVVAGEPLTMLEQQVYLMRSHIRADREGLHPNSPGLIALEGRQ